MMACRCFQRTNLGHHYSKLRRKSNQRYGRNSVKYAERILKSIASSQEGIKMSEVGLSSSNACNMSMTHPLGLRQPWVVFWCVFHRGDRGPGFLSALQCKRQTIGDSLLPKTSSASHRALHDARSGKQWKRRVLSGYVNSLLLNMAIEIVDLPIEYGDCNHSFM